MGAPSGTAAAKAGRSPRAIALVGPYLAGKTTLLEAILAHCGAIPRAGSVTEGSSIGDSSPEARDTVQSVEVSFAECEFMGETFTFIDLPGSIEFQADAAAVLPAVDAAVVVCEPDPKRVAALQVTLKALADRGIPYMIFLNKMDATSVHVRDILPMLQPASIRPLVLRQIPIWSGETVTGFVDLASERAYVYRDGAPSEIVEMPADLAEREAEARFAMLEQLADHDDALMEQLLSEATPDKSIIFKDLTEELRAGLICPVFLGSAARRHGIMRLLKALRHEAPMVTDTARRLGLVAAPSAVCLFKTGH